MKQKSKWPTLAGRLNNPITSGLDALLQLSSSLELSEYGKNRLKQLLNKKKK
jgi:hypothetical protein